MDRWKNCVAVVTGASAGIGEAIAKDLIVAGLRVVGLARRLERLEAIKADLPKNLQNNFYALKCDVGDKNSVDQAFDWIVKNLKGIDILVNNAGTLTKGQLLTLDSTKLEQTLQTNVMGVVHCTRRAFESMQARKVAGHVILINSLVGHRVIYPASGELPNLNIYIASKHAVTALTEVLRQEFSILGTKIKVTVSW